jgi:hypothetical protein
LNAIKVTLLLLASVASADDSSMAFPPRIGEKMGKIAQNKEDVSKMKSVLCFNNKPKFRPKAIFTVKYPSTPNMVLDDALKAKKKQMQLIRDYLKYYYFAAISGDVDKGEEYEAFKEVSGEPVYASDLGLIRGVYTFRIPPKVLEDTFKAYGDLNKQYFGYDYDSTSFSPRLALEHKDWIWQKYLANQTVVKEAPKGDSIRFQVELDLSMFCSFGVAATDLLSNN